MVRDLSSSGRDCQCSLDADLAAALPPDFSFTSPVAASRRSFLRALTGLAVGGGTDLVPFRVRAAESGPVQAAPQWNVSNSVILRDGQPFFPFGCYYIAHYPEQKKRRLHDLDIIAALGFNMIHTPVDLADAQLLDRCAARKLEVALEFNAEPELVLQAFSGHPAIAFLSTFDDVDARTPGGEPRNLPDTVRIRSSEIKRLAPNTLTYVSGGYPTLFPSFLGSSDLSALQSYPIPYEPLSAVTTAYLGPVAQQAQLLNRPLLANLQSFAWESARRFPTASEIRNMTYQALILGAKGILYYTFFDYNRNNPAQKATDLNNHPDLLKELASLAAEINRLGPVYAQAPRQPLNTGQSETFAARWDTEYCVYVAAANSGAAAATLRFSLPEKLGTPEWIAAPRLSPQVTFSGGVLQLSLAPGEVGVIRLGR